MDNIDAMDDKDDTGDEDVMDDMGEMPVSETESKRLHDDNLMSCAPSSLSTLPEKSDPLSSLSPLPEKSDTTSWQIPLDEWDMYESCGNEYREYGMSCASSSLSQLPEKSHTTNWQMRLDGSDMYESRGNEYQENVMSCVPSFLSTLSAAPSSSLSTLREKSYKSSWEIPMYESCGNEDGETVMSCAPSWLSALTEKSDESSWLSTLREKSETVRWKITLDEWDNDDKLRNESRDLFKTRTENIDGRKLIVKYAFRLTESPDAREWHDAESIYLSHNEFSNLPEEPVCPKLSTLSLERNYKLRKIPPAFFTNMPLLQSLDLSNTSIMSLPKSLFELSHLSELILKNCEFLMVLPPEVGKLKRLEVLNMEGTEIINLPIEIKELSLLIILRVSLYGCLDHDGKSSRQSNEIIPFGVISALSQLEDVSIDVNPDDERWDACVETILNEICGLTKLRILGLYFPRVELLSRLERDHYASTIYQSKFKLIVGGHSKRIIPRLPSNVEYQLNTRYKCLKYINGEGVPDVIKKVLQNATTFHLDRHMTATKLTEFGIWNMDSLEYCVLGECNEMQVIIDGDDILLGLESLEFMYIYYMKNLKSIWEGPVDEWSLSSLKSLTLSTCPQLTTIFTVGLLEGLHKLEELTVRDCPAIKSLVICEEGFKQFSSCLLNLRTISLHYVPELVSIFSEVCIAPKLEELSFYNCPKLKYLSIKEVSSKHLREITGEKDWWEALEWTQVMRNQFDCIFVPIDEDTCF